MPRRFAVENGSENFEQRAGFAQIYADLMQRLGVARACALV